MEAFKEASVEVTSMEISVEAFTEASVEATSVQASTTNFRGIYFHGNFHGSFDASMPWKFP